MDLSRWGIENPILSIVSAETESGKGLKVEVDAAKWCQAFEIDDAERLAKFNDNAKYEYYIRIFIHNPNDLAFGVTINLTNGEKSSFPDSEKAILTAIDGTSLEFETGNATEDAGPGSSVTIPENFTGWVAWKLDTLKPWSVKAGIESLNVDYIRLDFRPKGALGGEYYIVDSFCFSDRPFGTLAG